MLQETHDSRDGADGIRPAFLAHIVLRTGQPKAMIDWYKSVLNASIVHANDQVTFLTYDDEHHRIAIAHVPILGRRAKHRAGVDHVAFTYANLPDLLTHFAHLRSMGIEPIWSINHGPTTSLYYEDPDRNVLELQVDNFSSPEEIAEWMEGGDFNENPIGVDFDPVELKRRLDSGEDIKVLTARPRIGERSASSIPKAYLGRFASLAVRTAKALGAKV